MKKLILLIISALILFNGFSQTLNDSTSSASDSTVFKWITSDTGSGYFPIIPTSPLPEGYIPAKSPGTKPQNAQPGKFVSTMGYSAPPEVTHAHIPTSVIVDKAKNVGEIGINGQSSAGSKNYSIPIEMVEGRKGLMPEVQIAYSSGGGNGVLGYGWSIGGLSAIVSSNFTTYYDGVTNSASLNQLHPFSLDGTRLIQVSISGGVITYEPEQGNLRIKGYLSGTIVKYFMVEHPNGSKAVYGFETNATGQIFYPLTQITDISGNFVDYSYTLLNNQYYVNKISYGGVKSKAAHYATIDFIYKSRPDVESGYVMGKEIKEDRLLESVKVSTNGSLMRHYKFTYITDKVSLLDKVDCLNGAGGSLNPLKFYYGYDNNRTEALSTGESQLLEYFTSGDLDLRKGKFDAGTDDDGLMVFPKVQLGIDGPDGGIFQKEKKWFFSRVHPDQQLLVYQGLQDDFNLSVKLTADANFMELTSADLDGKQGEEVIKINNNDIGGWDNVKFKVYQPNIYSGLGLKYERSFNLTASVNFRGHNTSIWPKQYFTGDFKGIGRDMVFAVSMKNPLGMSYDSRCYLIDVENNQVLFNAHVFNWDSDKDQIIPADFNGDGKLDVMHIKPTGTDIYSFNNSNQLAKIKTITNFNTSSFTGKKMVMGDINGDGKIDILISPEDSYNYAQRVQVPVSKPRNCNYCGAGGSEINSMLANEYFCNVCHNTLQPSNNCYDCNSYLGENCSSGSTPPGMIISNRCCPVHGYVVDIIEYVYKDNGDVWKGYLATGEEFVMKDLSVTQSSNGDKFYLEDVNQDGKSDMLRIKAGSVYVYLNENGNFYYSNKFVYTTSNAIIVPSSVSNPHYHSFLMGIGVNQSGKLYKIRFSKNEAKQRLLTGVQNSRGIIERNFYQRMNEGASWGGSYDNVYTQGYGASLPYRNFTGPLWLAARIETYLNNELIANAGYNYYNAVVHMQGLGLRGFEKISTYDYVTGRVQEQTFDPINKFGALVKEVSPFSETNIQYNFSIASNKRVTLLPNSVTSLDKLTGLTTTKTTSHDSYGNPLTETVSYSNSNITQSVTTNYQNTVNTSTWQIGLPLTTSSTTTRGANSWTTKEEVAYYAGTMQPQSKISKVNNQIVAQTQWTYDTWGNVLTEKSQAYTSGTWLENKYEYDPLGRFVIKTTNPFGQNTNYANYNSYGKPTTITDFKSNLTINVFDNWGRVTQVTNPDGTTDTKAVAWAGTDPAGALIVVTESGTGKPTKKTFTDALGREIRTSVTRFNGAELKTDKKYDLYGRLSKVSLPYSSGTVLWNTYAYDGYDRPTTVTAANGNVVTYSYSGTSSTETKNGIASTRQFDAAGNIISITDAGGTITYTLRADGQPSTVIAPGNITTTFEYDQFGRRTRIVDPSAGTKTFGYDQWGNPNKETDANGKITKIGYDQYGRILSRTTPEISTSYSYNTDGLLQGETSSNGTGKNITYDILGRALTFKETGTDGKWLQKTYTYLQGQVATVSYTSQSGAITTETNSYDKGYLKKITLTGGQVIYDLQQENALGMATKVVSGPVTRNFSYDSYGMPTGRSAQTQALGTYMNFTYSFNAATGNLNSRKDVTRNLTESFTYDNLNRLSGFGGQTVSYDAKGNITQKSGIGTFHYLNSSKPYALSGIVQSGSVIPQRQQQITYASFSRPLSIAEDGYSAQFTYEAGGERVKMHVTKNGALVLKRHYLANQYELDEKPGSTKEKLYLGGDYYSAGAVLVRENGGAWQVFYINSDYLGSITHVVNSGGNLVAEYSYDAWGSLRNPANQFIFSSAQQPGLFLGRGYTGHEHLNWFGLINMNARLYDPVHGRFLAPDPYVQAPDFTQNYNRYSYALNNPLLYVDQDGEFIHLIVGAIIGGVVNVATNWSQIKAGGIWSGIGHFFVGAAGGALGANGNFALAGAIMGAGNTALAGGSFSQIALSAVTGAASGAVGGSVGGSVSKALSNANIGGLINGVTSGVSGGLAGGITAGVVGGLGNNILAAAGHNSFKMLSFKEITNNSLTYGWQGAAMGGSFGGVTMGAQAYLAGNNVWTGMPVAPGRSSFSLRNIPRSSDGWRLLHLNQYNANNEIMKTDQVWAKDLRTTNKSVPQYEVWGKSPQEFWDILSNQRGGSIAPGSRFTNPHSGDFFTYYLSSGQGPKSIPTIHTNSHGDIVKYRFPKNR